MGAGGGTTWAVGCGVTRATECGIGWGVTCGAGRAGAAVLPKGTDPLPAVADQGRISEVVRQLIDNACRYSHDAGSVQVRARTMDEGVVVSITDAGLAEVKETRRRRNEWLAGRLGRLDAAEREVLAQAVVLLRRLTDE